MKDMIGNPIEIGDIFIFPTGNPRFGGVKINIGLVFAKTEKRIKTLTTHLILTEKPSFAPSTKSPHKVLVVSDSSSLMGLESVKLLLERKPELK